MATKLAFVGLGMMGSGMAGNLLAVSKDLTVWNRSESRMTELVAKGARPSESLAALAEGADIVFLCIADTAAVREVINGEQGLANHLHPGSLVVDMSTISPTATVDLAARLRARKLFMLDAPVSGGGEGARDGTLSIMVGGPEDQVERALPYLQAMGKQITHVGPNGAGQMTKMVNQILVVGNTLTLSEALIFAKAADLDLDRTLQAVTAGAAGSWMLSNRAPLILEGDWTPHFTIDMQEKDLRLALAEAENMGVPALLTSFASQMYRILQREGHGGLGNHALIRALERMAGFEVRR